MILLLINFILATSFRLIATLGLYNFAHVAIAGMGAYTSGLLNSVLHWPFFLTLPLGILVSALTALLIGLPAVRTKGAQFFVITFAAGEALRWTWILLRNPFRGWEGLIGLRRPEQIPIPGLTTINFNEITSYFFLVLAFTLFSLVITYLVEKSRQGDTAKAIASNQDLCESMGINTYRFKLWLFVLSSSMAGLAGVLLSHYVRLVSPEMYNFNYCLNILIFVIVGGTGSFAGPIIGTFFLTAIGEVARGLLEYIPLLYGGILIVAVLTLPGGLVTLPERILPLVTRIKRTVISR
jgi:branched-chain amino acid transport system permease protein